MPTRPTTFDDATKLVTTPTEQYEKARRFYRAEGDAATDWRGPRASEDAPKKYRDHIEDAIQRNHSWRPLLREAAEFHLDAVLGREPDWGVTVPTEDETGAKQQPTPEKQQQAALLNGTLEEWWDEAQVHQAFFDASVEPLIGGPGALRLRFLTDEAGDLGAADVREAARRTAVDAVAADQFFEGVDDETFKPFSVVTYEVEVDGQQEKRVEVSWVDEEDLTHYAVYSEADDQGRESEGIDLGGLLMHVPVRGRLMATKAMLAQQEDATQAIMTENLNLEYGGFRERNLFNAQPFGKWVKDGTAPGGERFERDPSGEMFGPGIVNYRFSQAVEGQQGDTQYLPASMEVVEPVDPAYIHKTLDRAEEAILSMAKQRHRLISGVANVSGDALMMARSEFDVSVQWTEAGARRALERLLTVVIRLWSASVNQDLLDGLEVFARMRIYTGPLTSDEKRQLDERHRNGQISTRTYLLTLGYGDPDAEMARMRQDEEMSLSVLAKRMDLLKAALDAGARSIVEAAILAGFSEEFIERFRSLADEPGVSGDGQAGAVPEARPTPATARAERDEAGRTTRRTEGETLTEARTSRATNA